MVSSGGWTIAKAATIAIRYATVRRQGNKDADDLERQVITYPSVYHRLLPILADAFVFILLGRSLSNAFATMSSRLAAGDTSLLAEMHATTSGLKVLVSTTGIQDLETARRSMGGHGYSEFAGIGRMYADYLPSATYEGDNFVLDQQVVRAALKSYRHLLSLSSQSSSVLTPSTRYLRFVTAEESPSMADAPSWEDPHTAVLLLERRAAFMVKERATNDGDPDASVDQRVSKAVTEAFVAAQIDDILKPLLGRLADREASVVGKLLKLYLLMTVERALTDILSFDLIPGPTSPTLLHPRDSTRSVRMAIKQLCLELLPEAIGLIDAFGFTDWELDSALGVFDGDIYQTLWNKAQTEPLNHLQVPDGYEEYIKPMLERGQRLAARTKL
ncbi:Peroxisomal acyl-coenzyme A oxidase 1 [Grifola frondosa]|uniref:Peroxisomal acyl-coenzyme A oxidase 1 n=1 Tax=Grifola frondosa TaxID=5627 RepID=A0A1C7MCX8_GRIFR|nr:Peroxisomal acyl-coenzyme A oxidase 1 [Grifola frondosa]